MGRWIRVDVQWHDDLKAIKAKGWGMVVVRAVWEIVKAKYHSGSMPAECWDAEYIARWCLFYEERGGVRGIERGMAQALASGMLERADDGSIIVPNWRRYQIDSTAPERKSRFKSKDITPLPDAGTGGNESERNGTDGTSGNDRQDRTGQDNTHGARAPVLSMGGLRQRIWNSYQRGHESKYQMLPTQAGQQWQNTIEALEPAIADLLKRDKVPDDKTDTALDAIMEGYFKSTDERVVASHHAFALLPYHLTESVQRARRGGRRP